MDMMMPQWRAMWWASRMGCVGQLITNTQPASERLDMSMHVPNSYSAQHKAGMADLDLKM